MKGKLVERRFGWDCHGLPVEYEMEKELKISGKKEIEDYGIAKFNEACRSIVLRYTGEWRKTVTRMGRWVDFDNDYKTMNPDYMESIWWVVKQLWEKGLIYEGFYRTRRARSAICLLAAKMAARYSSVMGLGVPFSR